MSKTDVVLDAVFNVAERALKGNVGKFLCGEYLDGSTRSVPDALTGEMKSPKQRRKEEKRRKEALKAQEDYTKPKKKKKHKKKKKSRAVLKL